MKRRDLAHDLAQNYRVRAREGQSHSIFENFANAPFAPLAWQREIPQPLVLAIYRQLAIPASASSVASLHKVLWRPVFEDDAE